MESEQQTAHDALHEVAGINADRLRRPQWYWPGLGALLALFGLIPYLPARMPILTFLAPVVLLAVIVILAARAQPSAVRNLRLSVRMWLPLLGLALLTASIVLLAGLARAQLGWWWVPRAAAGLVLIVVCALGPVLDRVWGRQASHASR